MGSDKFRRGLREHRSQFSQMGDPHARVTEPENTAKQNVAESEIMATAFAALTTGDINVEWERIVPVIEASQSSVEDEKLETCKTNSLPASSADKPNKTRPARGAVASQIDPQLWQGRHWDNEDLSARPSFRTAFDVLKADDPFTKIDPQQLTNTQRDLLERFAHLSPHHIQELNLRFMQRNPAMEQLRRTVAKLRSFRVRYLRIVTGKGIGSAGDPVLRQEILRWCIMEGERQRLQWVPELDPSHEYGAILVDLNSPKDPKSMSSSRPPAT